jgi:hypothetical protein
VTAPDVFSLRQLVKSSFTWRKGSVSMTNVEYLAALEREEKVKGFQWGPDPDLVRQLVLAEKKWTPSMMALTA